MSSDPGSSMQRVGSSARLGIVVPTYCEAENIRPLLDAISAALAPSQIDYCVTFVDDASPDDTAGAVRACIDAGLPARLIVREGKRDLSTAVIRGFQDHPEAEFLLCMDADLSHPAAVIPEMLRVLQADPGTGIVVGSRYVAGGRTEAGWGLWNVLNSRIATALARPLTGISDPMSGFFVIRRSVFESAPKLDPVGYKVLLELLVKCRIAKAREWPIEFQRRHQGESKLGLRERINYLKHLKHLYNYRFGDWARYLQFGMVGVTGFAVDLLLFSLLLGIGMSIPVARALAIGTALSSNFLLNRQFTFDDARGDPVLRQYIAYLTSCLLGNSLSWCISVGLALFQGVQPLLAAVIGILLGSVFNFLLVRRTAFRR